MRLGSEESLPLDPRTVREVSLHKSLILGSTGLYNRERDAPYQTLKGILGRQLIQVVVRFADGFGQSGDRYE